MSKQSLSRTVSLASRALRSSTTSNANRLAPRGVALVTRPAFIAAARFQPFTTSSAPAKGILPDSDNPSPPNVQENETKAVQAELTDAEYHEVADAYLEIILSRLEEIAEKDEGVDVEYSSGVLNVTFPEIGAYVINKQPPNKQIWLSSPISGPKRYDYVVYGEGQNQKEDTAVGDWVYLRDRSTISELFAKELDIALALPIPQ